ncbi:tetratricopeptide repeat protein [Salinimicrobium sp. CAU 1759]
MFNKYKFLLILLMLAVVSCNEKQGQVTQVEDYDPYLQEDSEIAVKQFIKDHNFWQQKLENNPEQFPYLAQLASSQARLFEVTGEIEYLKKAEENLISANEATGYRTAGYLKSLARNYISQHRFREALELLNKAEQTGEKINGTHKMLFDVHMELGNYDTAEAYLEKIEDRSDFDFLLRYAKWSDHKGDLDTAITYMEKATEKAELTGKKNLMQWAYTNLADFYGHNGEIEKSYQHFLKALELDPLNAYAKKGIAWIVYSHERNPEEALRILDSVTKQHKSPDYYLLKAEIAEYINDRSLKNQNLESFMAAVSNKNYGEMYNATNAILFAEEFAATEEALELAKQEVANRPTPQSYDLLAWSHYNSGNYNEALQIAEQHIVDHTFEPEALFHLAKIYKATGNTEKAKDLKKELLDSAYELGPVAEQEIRKI